MKTKPYTTRNMPVEALDRMRLLAAVETARQRRKITLEAILARVIALGLPAVEAEILPREGASDVATDRR